jgi:hypothetical protein
MQNITGQTLNAYADWFVYNFHTFYTHPFWMSRQSVRLPFGANTQRHTWPKFITPANEKFGTLQRDPNGWIARILVETGFALTPSVAPLGDCRAGFAIVRYAEFFRNSSASGTLPLLLNDDPSIRSSRLKALMAEELAIGIACFLLREYHDVEDIIEYQVWKQSLNQQFGGEQPDYFCFTHSGLPILVEVKGSITLKKDTLRDKRNIARDQLLNGRFAKSADEAIGRRYCIATNLMIGDPPGKNPLTRTFIDVIVPSQTTSDTDYLVSKVQDESTEILKTMHFDLDFIYGEEDEDKNDKRKKPKTRVAKRDKSEIQKEQSRILKSIPRLTKDVPRISCAKALRFAGQDIAADAALKDEQGVSEKLKYLPRRAKIDLLPEYNPVGVDPMGNMVLMKSSTLAELDEGVQVKRTLEKDYRKRNSEESILRSIFHINESIVVCPNPMMLSADDIG